MSVGGVSRMYCPPLPLRSLTETFDLSRGRKILLYVNITKYQDPRVYADIPGECTYRIQYVLFFETRLNHFLN